MLTLKKNLVLKHVFNTKPLFKIILAIFFFFINTHIQPTDYQELREDYFISAKYLSMLE